MFSFIGWYPSVSLNAITNNKYIVFYALPLSFMFGLFIFFFFFFFFNITLVFPLLFIYSFVVYLL